VKTSPFTKGKEEKRAKGVQAEGDGKRGGCESVGMGGTHPRVTDQNAVYEGGRWQKNFWGRFKGRDNMRKRGKKLTGGGNTTRKHHILKNRKKNLCITLPQKDIPKIRSKKGGGWGWNADVRDVSTEEPL